MNDTRAFNYFEGEHMNNVPHFRQAYSDRAASLMAQLSMMAYIDLDASYRAEQIGDQLRANSINETEALEVLAELTGIIRSGDSSNADHVRSLLQEIDCELVANLSGSTGIKYEVTQGFAAVHRDEFGSPDKLILAFRGTEDLQDAIADLNFTRKDPNEDLPGGYFSPQAVVHAGFFNAFLEVRSQLETLLEKYPTLPVYVTGHSLGGAIAKIAAIYFEAKYNRAGMTSPVSACYTFGSPKVGNNAFYGNTKTPIYRIVNEIDPVPALPLAGGKVWALMKVVDVFAWITSFFNQGLSRKISAWSEKKKRPFENFKGFSHFGDERYLANIDESDREQMQKKLENLESPVIHNPQAMFKVLDNRNFKINRKSFADLLNNHRIIFYVTKLSHWAKRRNQLSLAPPPQKGIYRWEMLIGQLDNSIYDAPIDDDARQKVRDIVERIQSRISEESK